MTEFATIDKTIIQLLLKKQRITPFLLHLEHKFSPAQIADSIERLENSGILQRRKKAGEAVVLAKNALSIIFKLRHQIYQRKVDWKRDLWHASDKLFRPQVGLFQFNFSYLGRDFTSEIDRSRNEVKVRKRVD